MNETMTNEERELLIWCSVMLLRTSPLHPAEVHRIDAMISEIRKQNPEIDLTLNQKKTGVLAYDRHSAK